MRLLSSEEQDDQVVSGPILRFVPGMNCGQDGHCAKTGVDPDAIVWVGAMPMCPRCPRHPHNQPWQRPAAA